MMALAEYFSKKPWPDLRQKSATDAEAAVANRVNVSIGCTGCHLGQYQGDATVPRLAGQQHDYLLKSMRDFRSRRPRQQSRHDGSDESHGGSRFRRPKPTFSPVINRAAPTLQSLEARAKCGPCKPTIFAPLFSTYFARNGHEVVPSSPLVPRNDPTLLFTNAGMVQFKNVFTGAEKRPYSPRHHVAEMRPRRRQAQRSRECRLYRAASHVLRDARQFLLRRLFQGTRHRAGLESRHQGIRHFAKDRLTATVYAEDDDAAKLWRKIAGLPDSRIIRIATSDNFWAMGETGPCGPCSEIFYDHGDHIAGGPPGSPDADGDRFVEIWNLVFMQYEQVTREQRANLPRPSIDTGMGLERIAAVLQGKHDNYDTDILRALIAGLGRGVERRRRRAAGGVAPRHRRSSARLVLPDRRRRAAVEGGPRLRAAPDHAPRHAPRAHPRLQGAADVAAGAGAGAADGRGLSRAGARRAADHRDAEARGDRLQAHARTRPQAARRRGREARRRRSRSPATSRSSSTTPMASRSI